MLKLKEYGLHIWFDENIEPASTWDDNIAEHIERAEYFVSMITPAYLDSRNCLDELRYALSQENNNKQFLIYLQDVSLPKGIAMRTGGVQNIFRKSFDTDDAMIQYLSQANGIDVCIQRETDNLYPDMDDFANNLLKMAIEANPTEAFRWYTKAALQNHATAQNHLGVCYDTGIGTEIDHEKACYWFKQAAESGHAGAQLNLGLSYKNGEGVAQDIDMAKKWLQLSADQGENRAKRVLLSIALMEICVGEYWL